MEGKASPVEMAAILVALKGKGVKPAEVAGGVRALRRVMVPVAAEDQDSLVDTAGTGGGRVTTFNISTAAALVAAGAGVRVAKHGNRSFTSRCGSADVLEALGVRIDLDAAAMGRILSRVGIVFMFAPLLHPAMRHVGPVRKELGVPTVMNVLGPLTNPAGARRQVLGVSDPELLRLLVEALRELGHVHALVVHGEPGMDEVSPSGATRVAELAGGRITEYQLSPSELGLEPAPEQELAGGTPEDNAALIRSLLSGERTGGALTATLLNAGAAIYVSGRVSSIQEGVGAAARSIDTGAALTKLEALREESHR
jgi:anthranilate phosphoribosyltransferase